MRLANIGVMVVVAIASVLGSVYRTLHAAELSVEEARRFALPLIESERIDGLSVGIIDGPRHFTFHLGAANDGQTEADDNTIYEIGSISKVFTGLLLADAVTKDPGMLERTPNSRDCEVRLPLWQDQSITWLDLATHQSGLPRLADNFTTGQSKDPYATYDSTKAIEFLRRHQLRRQPGTQHEYSNFAFSWLGYLLANRERVSYEQLLKHRITGPLEMTDTAITLAPNQSPRLATPHSSYGKETSYWDFADLPGAGGIRSSISDMMKFMHAQLDPLNSSLRETSELAWKQHNPGSENHLAMGLGWYIARDGNTRFHNGQTGGFHSAMFVNRKRSIAVVVLANTGPADEVDVLAERLTQRLAGIKVQPQKLSKATKVDRKAMANLVGRYELSPTFIFDVNVINDSLMVGITNQTTQEVFPITEVRWFYKGVDAELTFELGENGLAESLVLHQNGIQQTAKRID
ncbi:Beta-lactamase precursor [Planctomycetes bacterium CA13]|uniref:Beta-lactamase n=1 Tax=Novipirellula herctigrandis TaxID=2527986 RepID=A0A5C5YMR6_9BACT|nr:Beta-lactamase precursor [Planctomycetes bacterium CA13]